jgi:hypothetical protein
LALGRTALRGSDTVPLIAPVTADCANEIAFIEAIKATKNVNARIERNEVNFDMVLPLLKIGLRVVERMEVYVLHSNREYKIAIDFIPAGIAVRPDIF